MTVYEEYLKFLESHPGYQDEIVSAAITGGHSLSVEFTDLYDFSTELASTLLEEPDSHLKAFREAFYERYRLHAVDQISESDLHVRISGHPNPLSHREIGSEHVSKFIGFSGITLSTSQVLPLIVTAVYNCDCGALTFIQQEEQFLRKPKQCGECQSRDIRLDPSKSTFIDIQYLGVQEMPEQLPPGQLPISFIVELRDDICGSVTPGDRVVITGIFQARQKKQTSNRILESYIEANHVEIVSRGLETIQISPEEEKEILELAADPWIYRRVIQSIAPTIYGLEHVKEAVALELFGGVSKAREGNRLRGDINVLLVGDPGTGKSQILQHAIKVSPRGLYTTGRGSTAAGLTAAVIKNQNGFTLEAGALVLADTGLCCIDELEKMRDEDRGAIHPAMEQQVVSIAKGGIVATLNARCSILAAANPTLGRYEPYQTVAQNISNLSVTLLSRFDLIFIVKDPPERTKDELVSSHVLKLHREDTPSKTGIPIRLLRKYISYSKKITPKLTEEAAKLLQTFYVDMRTSSVKEGVAAAISITVRQLESLIRLSEARARLHLRDEVLAEDAEAAIALTRRSLEQVSIDVETGKIDIDIIMTGTSSTKRQKLRTVITVIDELAAVNEKGAYISDIVDTLQRDHGMNRMDAASIVAELMEKGLIYAPRPDYYRRMHSRIIPKETEAKPVIEPQEELMTPEEKKNLQEELDKVWALVFDWKDGLHTDKVASELGIEHDKARRLLNILKRKGTIVPIEGKEGWWRT